jgi:hypothetical protein
LRVHRGRSRYVTPQEAVYAVTLSPATILGLANRIGSFDVGKDLSFIEARLPKRGQVPATADDAIRGGLLELSETDLRAYEPGREFGAIVDRLQATGLPVGDDLNRLTADFAATARRLDDKIVRVTLAGRTAYSR